MLDALPRCGALRFSSRYDGSKLKPGVVYFGLAVNAAL
jgi:hypothetical protein